MNFNNSMNNKDGMNNRRQTTTRQTNYMGGFIENPGANHQYLYGNINDNYVNNNGVDMEYINNNNNHHHQVALSVGNAGGVFTKSSGTRTIPRGAEKRRQGRRAHVRAYHRNYRCRS